MDRDTAFAHLAEVFPDLPGKDILTALSRCKNNIDQAIDVLLSGNLDVSPDLPGDAGATGTAGTAPAAGQPAHNATYDADAELAKQLMMEEEEGEFEFMSDTDANADADPDVGGDIHDENNVAAQVGSPHPAAAWHAPKVKFRGGFHHSIRGRGASRGAMRGGRAGKQGKPAELLTAKERQEKWEVELQKMIAELEASVAAKYTELSGDGGDGIRVWERFKWLEGYGNEEDTKLLSKLYDDLQYLSVACDKCQAVLPRPNLLAKKPDFSQTLQHVQASISILCPCLPTNAKSTCAACSNLVDTSVMLTDDPDTASSPLFHCPEVQALVLALGMRYLQHDHYLHQKLENGNEEERASKKKLKVESGGKKGRKKSGASGVGYGGTAGDYYGGGGGGGGGGLAIYDEMGEELWSEEEDYDSDEDFGAEFYYGMGGLSGKKKMVEASIYFPLFS
ncbi:hypothetical protein BC937DRAFT_87810 [Endogone sp. FLAS-F59071]|nr:hypothetical protein BC937DRAFT_87810 [Endogone sp. FLAS-F59071]|eukprot:RUS19225.1 hypothetical protein BC937DRAFT_87810 [Endogone sp. FLAS-F59071]